MVPHRQSIQKNCYFYSVTLIYFINWTIIAFNGASLMVQTVENLPAIQETQVWSLGWEDPLEKRMATHSSILAWRIPRTEEPGGLQCCVSFWCTAKWISHMFTYIHPLPSWAFLPHPYFIIFNATLKSFHKRFKSRVPIYINMPAVYMYLFLNDSRLLTWLSIPRLPSSHTFKTASTLYGPSLPEISQPCLFACVAHLGRVLCPMKPHCGYYFSCSIGFNDP